MKLEYCGKRHEFMFRSYGCIKTEGHQGFCTWELEE